jgi:hypothetical protein
LCGEAYQNCPDVSRYSAGKEEVFGYPERLRGVKGVLGEQEATKKKNTDSHPYWPACHGRAAAG